MKYLKIEWSDTPGCFDVIPMQMFIKEGDFPARTHSTENYKIERHYLRCSLKVNGDKAVIDYGGDNEQFNAEVNGILARLEWYSRVIPEIM